MHNILTGDVREHLSALASDSFDGCLTDPPYGLSFMGKAWDHGVPSKDVWAEVLRVLKPGAHLLAFGGTRTHHRLMCAIEDAGFEIRDCCMWLYGSGFPKAKSCLKPAWEPIIFARKRSRVAPLNIDGCRIGTEENTGRTSGVNSNCYGTDNRKGMQRGGNSAGRWPANVLLDEEAAAALDEQSGSVMHGAGNARVKVVDRGYTASSYNLSGPRQMNRFGDAGGASRFFYTAKASSAERGAGNNHPCVKPLKLIEYLAKLILPPNPEAKLLVPYSGSGSEILGARNAGWQDITGIEISQEYCDIAERRLSSSVPPLFQEAVLEATA